MAKKSKAGGKRPGAGRPKGPLPATVAKRKAIQHHRTLTAEATIEQIRRGCQFDIRDLFDDTGNIKPIHLLTEIQATQIAGFEVVKRNMTAGDGHIDQVIKVKLVDRAKYVEMAAKYHGLLMEKVEVTGEVTLAQKVAAARQRLAAAK